MVSLLEVSSSDSCSELMSFFKSWSRIDTSGALEN